VYLLALHSAPSSLFSLQVLLANSGLSLIPEPYVDSQATDKEVSTSQRLHILHSGLSFVGFPDFLTSSHLATHTMISGKLVSKPFTPPASSTLGWPDSNTVFRVSLMLTLVVAGFPGPHGLTGYISLSVLKGQFSLLPWSWFNCTLWFGPSILWQILLEWEFLNF
jgi:hypothetical protein